MTESALHLEHIQRRFGDGSSALTVLRDVNLTIETGDIVALVGPSGAGKSTLLHIAGLLEKPTSGSIQIGGQPCNTMNDEKRTLLRRASLGFVYQYHHLLPEFSAIENVCIPQYISGVKKRDAKDRAADLLKRLGLGERLTHRPGQLSGGEQQRVAIARALANRPKLVLADEPTGNLDPQTADGVFDLMLGLAREEGLAALVATHNPALAARMDRTVRVENGMLIEA